MQSENPSNHRIALVTRRFSWERAGGGEVSATLLARHLAQRGHEVDVFAVEVRGAPKGAAENLRVHPIPNITTWHVRAALRAHRPALVHSYNMESAPATVMAARSLRIPVVVTANSAWATCLFADMYRPRHGVCETCTIEGVRDCFRYRPSEQVGRRVPAVVGWAEVQRRLWVLRGADRVIVLSNAAKRMLARSGVPPERVRVVPNLENTLFRVTRAPDGERILYVGALSFPKGTDVLVRAFAQIARKHPGARLELAGEGNYRNRLEALAHELNIADRVDFPGYVPHDQLPEHYRRASVAAFPVRTEEAFGRVILEAWASGVPLVASRISAPGEIITNEKTGLLVPPEDPEALAQAILRVLDDRALADKLREGGRRELEKYAPESVLPRVLGVYEEVLAP